MIYFIIIATLLFFGYFVKKPKKYYLFCLVMLFSFTAFRDINLGGTDAIVYQNYFESAPLIGNFMQNTDSFKYEIGYTFINSFSKTFINSYTFYQIIYTSISILLLNHLIKKLDFTYRERCLFLFVYFCFRYFLNNFVLLRQNIANLIIWILIIQNWKNVKKTALSIYISSLFHATSLFNFIVWPVFKCISKFRKEIILLSTLFLSIVLLFTGSGYINAFINFFINFAGDKYTKYLINNDSVVRGFNFIYYIIRWVILFAFFIYYDKIHYQKKNILFYTACIGIVVGSVDIEIFTRMMEYYMIAFYAICVVIFRCINAEDKKKLVFLLYVLLMIILIRSLLTTSSGMFCDYKFLDLALIYNII